MLCWGLTRDPIWAEFGRIQRNLDELARHMSSSVRFPLEPVWRRSTIFPALNVTKEGSSYIVSAEIPGMNQEDLEISVEGDTLSLKGERKPDQLGEGVSFHRRERASGSFQRSITLPGRVDPDEVKATYADGVLTITLPMEKAALPKQIAVTTG